VKIAGSKAACPSMWRTCPNSGALAENSRHLQGGLCIWRVWRMACVWNNNFTVWGLERTILTLCFRARRSYAFSGDACRIFRTMFVMTVFCSFVRLGTTIVPHKWKGTPLQVPRVLCQGS
jgi:hypothetical protein